MQFEENILNTVCRQ